VTFQYLRDILIHTHQGSFGPMANAFSICSLSQHWRFEIPPGKTQRIDIVDPDWLVFIYADNPGM